MNCPFYGRHMFRPSPTTSPVPFLLIDSGQGSGNQCALVIEAYSPCLYTDERDIDWRECPRVKDVRL